MAIRTEKIDDVVIVLPDGMLKGDKETRQLEHELRRLLELPTNKILLDLRNTTHLNSIAIGVVAGVHASAANRGAAFFVCNVERRITNVLTILKLVNVLRVHDTREDAMAAFAKLPS